MPEKANLLFEAFLASTLKEEITSLIYCITLHFAFEHLQFNRFANGSLERVNTSCKKKKIIIEANRQNELRILMEEDNEMERNASFKAIMGFTKAR